VCKELGLFENGILLLLTMERYTPGPLSITISSYRLARHSVITVTRISEYRMRKESDIGTRITGIVIEELLITRIPTYHLGISLVS